MKWIKFTDRYPGEDEWLADMDIAYMLVECDIETMEPLQPLNPIILNGTAKLAFWSDDIVIDDIDIVRLDPMTNDYNGEELPKEVSEVYTHIDRCRNKEYTRHDTTYERCFMDYAWMPWNEYIRQLFSEMEK